MRGKVKWYNVKKRFGFIEGEDGRDYFVHQSQIKERLGEGEEVTFEPIETDKGLQANNVTKE